MLSNNWSRQSDFAPSLLSLSNHARALHLSFTVLIFTPCRAIPFHDTYYNVVEGLEEAIEHASNGGDCSRYQW